MHRPNVVVSCPFSDILNYLVDDCGLDINQYGGSKILCQCASSPNLELAQLVLKQGVDPSDGMNAALLTCTQQDNVDLAKVLVGYSCVTSSPKRLGKIACDAKSLDMLQLLQSNGADLTWNNSKLFRRACTEYDNVDIVKFLLTVPGIDPYTKNHKPLRGAAKRNKVAIVEVLVHLPGTTREAKGKALCAAAKATHLEVDLTRPTPILLLFL